MEGNGDSAIGQRHEWATVKDQELFMGSDGSLGKTRQWVAIVNTHTGIRHVDWAANYERARTALGVTEPGYVTHEAVEWSDVHNKWFLLPRRVGTTEYDETEDAYRGANKLVMIASEGFETIEVADIGKPMKPERGFSSFKFVPSTHDSIMLAIKTVELGDQQNAFLTAFDIHGNVLLYDIEIPDNHKYEGIAFLHH